MIPRAIPQSFLAKYLPKHGLGKFSYHIDIQGHSWIPISPRLLQTGEWSEEIIPLGQSGPASLPPCRFPWSNPHLSLAERMGQPLSQVWDQMLEVSSGSAESKVRIAEMI